MATPVTEVRLLNNVDLDLSYNNTFSRKLFTNLAGQINFFKAKTVYTFANLTFQRKDNTLKVKRRYEDVEKTNYGMFKNGVSGKWYFFFILDYKYISDDVTEITLEIDVEQTYLFDINMKDSFVEREHVSDDTIGAHLVDEGLNTGEYVTVSKQTTDFLNELAIVVATTYDPGTSATSVGEMIRGVYQGCAYYVFGTESDDIDVLNDFLSDIVTAGKEDSVVSIFMTPSVLLIPFLSGDKIFDSGTPPTSSDEVVKNLTYLDTNYRPKNNKLFTYPYNFLYVTNNAGSSGIYRYEFFSTPTDALFELSGDIGPSPTVLLIPKLYKGVSRNHDEMLRINDFPLCSWNNDAFQSYLAQKAVTYPASLAGTGLGALATGGAVLAAGFSAPVSATIGAGIALAGVVGSIGSFYEASLQSSQSRGGLGGYANVSAGINNFHYYKKTIRKETARIIDDYFTRYGYKVNVVKKPDVTSRTRFNYLKLQDPVITGNIPKNALSTILNNRLKGITFWHVDAIGDYTTSNAIV